MRSLLNKHAAGSGPQPDLPFVPPLWRRWNRRTLRDALFVAMMSIGWIAGNALAVLGCVMASFILIAHGDFAIFMAHVDNLASRYVSATPDRQSSFEREVLATLGLVSAVLLLIRLPRFVVRLRVELSQEKSHADHA